MHKVKTGNFVQFITMSDSMDLFAGHSIFRGQAINGNLLPGIARDNQHHDTFRLEENIFKQFELMGASFLNSNYAKLDKLVFAQHFGLKTRLLDWTSNPLAALWFACADAMQGDAYVYTLDVEKLQTKDVYEINPFEQTETQAFQPRLNNERIIAQHGWFTLHAYSQTSKQFVALEKHPNIAPHLIEFTIPSEGREEILKSLDRHGINERTLFPDVIGLCHYLNWKYCIKNIPESLF